MGGKVLQLESERLRAEGRTEGWAEGRAEGIAALVLDNLEEGVSTERILVKLQKRFSLDLEQAERYYKQFSQEDSAC